MVAWVGRHPVADKAPSGPYVYPERCMSRDRLTSKRRSWNMSRVRGKDTSPERTVRSLLFRLGYRFRLHARDLPGRPDIVLPKYRTVIFVHGCFWHRHAGCKRCTTPANRQAWWLKKLEGNVARDERNRAELELLGWRCLVVWECETHGRSLEKLGAELPKMIEGISAD